MYIMNEQLKQTLEGATAVGAIAYGRHVAYDILMTDRQTHKHIWVPHPLTTRCTRTAHRPERRACDAKVMMGHFGSTISNREGGINPNQCHAHKTNEYMDAWRP
jgi:hypothetical protein